MRVAHFRRVVENLPTLKLRNNSILVAYLQKPYNIQEDSYSIVLEPALLPDRAAFMAEAIS